MMPLPHPCPLCFLPAGLQVPQTWGELVELAARWGAIVGPACFDALPCKQHLFLGNAFPHSTLVCTGNLTNDFSLLCHCRHNNTIRAADGQPMTSLCLDWADGAASQVLLLPRHRKLANACMALLTCIPTLAKWLCPKLMWPCLCSTPSC